MKNETLYSLAIQAMELSRSLLESGGEITPEIEAALEINEQSLVAKTDSYAAVLDRLEAEEGVWRERRDSCERMLRAHEGLQERIKERIKGCMLAMGRDELTGQVERLRLSKAKSKLIVDSSLPNEFYMIKTETVPDKERIRSALEAGDKVPGAALVPSFSLRRYLTKKG